MSTRNGSILERDCKMSKQSDAESYLKPFIGFTAEQLKIAQQSTYWKFWRITAIVVFWLLWASMVAGAVIIIVLNNGDVPSSTTTVTPPTTKQK
ncbi:hypothetical protein RB195_016142 [Necator americanus]|uniref:Solute carrier family 3 member 2 N-terminal domain-containing protein n=1 Tax=Necator americanus TaxID=51031 RepID=A0ABR1E7R5_NECAM